jgi:CDP-glucose 4,6-dehydratase
MKEVLNFYKEKKIFITGHTGFKGAWLTHLLLENGAKVKGFSKSPNTTPSLFDLLNLSTKIDSCLEDINDYSILEKEILEFQPDFIFHMAAQPLVRYSYLNSVETHQTNIIGTANVLEISRKVKNKCIIVCITTDKVYKNKEWEYPYTEKDELGGYDPYSSSKAATELIISSYRESYFKQSNIQVASARAGNVIGGGDWSLDRLVPDLVKSVEAKQKLILRNPNSIRPWQHVLDPLFAYLKLGMLMSISEDKFDQPWNFGPKNNQEKSVLDVVKIFYETYELPLNYEINNLGQPHEAGILKLDISKASKFMNWIPIFDTRMAIQRTALWYKLFSEGESAIELVNNDIKTYLNYNETDL